MPLSTWCRAIPFPAVTVETARTQTFTEMPRYAPRATAQCASQQKSGFHLFASIGELTTRRCHIIESGLTDSYMVAGLWVQAVRSRHSHT